MSTYARSKHRKLLVPLLTVAGVIGLLGYSVVAAISQDPLWYLGRASLPEPRRIVLRVGGEETLLTTSSPGYDLIIQATEKAMSAFDNLAPLTTGLNERTLAEYRQEATVLELYFDEPVDFHMPFYDAKPTALLIPIKGRYADRNYVFRGKRGKWWAGPMRMSDPRPLYDALWELGYIQR